MIIQLRSTVLIAILRTQIIAILLIIIIIIII